jgi:hypothetical protein
MDEELGRLSERCRSAFVLCCLEGRSGPEAARELGCALKAVESRLARARDRLRARLARRGLLLPASAALALMAPASGAAVPAQLISVTLRAATSVPGPWAVGAATSANVIALTEGVLRAMVVSKLKNVGAVMLAAGFVVVGAGGLGYRSWAGDGPPVAQSKPGDGEKGANPAVQASKDASYFLEAQYLLRQVAQEGGQGEERELLRQLEAELRAQQESQQRLRERLDQFRKQLDRRQPERPKDQPAAKPATVLDFYIHRENASVARQEALVAIEGALPKLKGSARTNDAERKAVDDFERAFLLMKQQLAQVVQEEQLRTRRSSLLALSRMLATRQALGAVRGVTPEGLVILEVQGVRQGQVLELSKEGGPATVGEVIVLAAADGYAVARVEKGRAEAGYRVRERGQPSGRPSKGDNVPKRSGEK